VTRSALAPAETKEFSGQAQIRAVSRPRWETEPCSRESTEDVRERRRNSVDEM